MFVNMIGNIEEYKNYFSQIANSHRLISSFEYGDVDQVIDFLSSSRITDSYLMWLEPYTAKPDLSTGRTISKKSGSLVVMHPWEPGNYTTAKSKNELEEACEQIVIDIISKIYKDNDESTIHTDLKFRYDIIDVTFTGNYVGCRLEFNYDTHISICYNTDNWN